jgi:thiol-disulfide isomerase/thioredoxin
MHDLSIRISLLCLLATAAAMSPLTRDDADRAVRTLPPERGGQELLGQAWPELSFDAWLGTPDGRPLETEGRLTLYRWWTDGCPYCDKSLPALEQLRKEFERSTKDSAGLQVVAVYHPKPAREITASDHQGIIDAARKRGYRGAIAIDADWSELKKAWLDAAPRDATSASFLVDDRFDAAGGRNDRGGGTIRFVHPGPQFFASDDPEHVQDNSDFTLLRDAIRTLLMEKEAQAPANGD